MKKRWGTMLLAGLLGTALLSGCGSSASDSASSAAESNPSETTTTAEGTKEDLIFVNYRDIRDLNPHLYAGEMYAQEMLYEGLVNITSDGFEGCLAESWDVSDDGKVYTFHIRPGVTFSDGEKCDAYAIKANFDAILENKDRHTWLEMMHLLVGVDAPDENTFVIELSEPYYPLLTELGVTRPFAMISPKAMKNGSTKDGVEAYIGTGPYVLDEFVTDEYAVFKANPNYWGEQPAIKTITVKVIPDNQTRILALEKGEIDMIFGKNMIDADAINQYLDSDQFTVELSDPTSTRQIVLNTSSDILSEKDVRIALQHATNKQNISDGIFYGLEKPADTLFASTVPYCDIELEPYVYDLELAGQILDEAGWKMGSGNVREKLRWAKRSAELYPEDYGENVRALEAVQPVDLTASEISVRLGATWLPPETIEEFMFELFSTPRYCQWNIHVHYAQYTGEWNVEGKSYDRSNVKAHNTYGTGRVNGYKIMEETLNLRDVRIFDYIEDGNGRKTAVLNKKETAIAQGKQELIKQAFADWIWSEPERREQLTKLYNEKFNSIRPREYDGSHLNFVGINPEITLRPHQVNAIAHILYGGNTLLAHVVGAGKSATRS